MGSGTGLASGFGRLREFGLEQPVLAVCGDSTFFHAAIPALINAVHHRADLTMVILDNRGTAMTGFQPHPGLPVNAMQENAPAVEMEQRCRGMGVETEIRDPFDLNGTRDALLALLEKKAGARVLILRQACALSPEKKGKNPFRIRVDEQACRGDRCGCNRLCTRVFRCPGLFWDAGKGVAGIDDVVCAGCGVCASICPAGAILKEDAV
jgi:indolepyruvate ferredoxin oxidoreductase alpha subunit